MAGAEKKTPAAPVKAGGRGGRDARGRRRKRGVARGPPGARGRPAGPSGDHWIDSRFAPATAFFGSVSSSTPFSNFAPAFSSSISSVSAKLRANAP